jgi:hypothetical protein
LHLTLNGSSEVTIMVGWLFPLFYEIPIQHWRY